MLLYTYHQPVTSIHRVSSVMDLFLVAPPPRLAPVAMADRRTCHQHWSHLTRFLHRPPTSSQLIWIGSPSLCLRLSRPHCMLERAVIFTPYFRRSPYGFSKFVIFFCIYRSIFPYFGHIVLIFRLLSPWFPHISVRSWSLSLPRPMSACWRMWLYLPVVYSSVVYLMVPQ